MFEKLKFWIIVFFALLIIFFIIPADDLADYFKYNLYSKNDLKLNLVQINPKVSVLAADPSNGLVLRAEVRDSQGEPVPMAYVTFSVDEGLGEVYPSGIRSDRYGQCLVTYRPPAYLTFDYEWSENPGMPLKKVTINAVLSGKDIRASVDINLTNTPVVYVHGYQETGYIFDNMKEYLDERGFMGSALTYKSENGVASAAKELGEFLKEQKDYYLSRGIQAGKFDIIAHSMGGLVARFYTCSQEYINRDDVRKIIFISVPHKGSPLASLGAGYFKDQAVRDMIVDNNLFKNIFPSMINRGLNHKIQVGNIIGLYDEVVSLESAGLDEWRIDTEIFNVGENSINMDSILKGTIMEASVHKNILNNRKVFEAVQRMLSTDLPCPARRK